MHARGPRGGPGRTQDGAGVEKGTRRMRGRVEEPQGFHRRGLSSRFLEGRAWDPGQDGASVAEDHGPGAPPSRVLGAGARDDGVRGAVSPRQAPGKGPPCCFELNTNTMLEFSTKFKNIC